jgi:beta propeller repeat protein
LFKDYIIINKVENIWEYKWGGNMRSKIISIVLIAMFLTLILPIVSSAGRETRLTWDIGSGTGTAHPIIYGNKVVWSDWDGISDWNEIIVYDVKTGKSTAINIPVNNSTEHPAIYGNKMVWSFFNTYNVSNVGLYVYDISTSESSLITEEVYGWVLPDIYDNIIVWSSESSDYKSDVYMHDISTHTQTRITTSGSAKNPAIYGNRIVWEDARNSDVYMYDLFTKKETRITTNGTASQPNIYGNRILWIDDGGRTNGKSDIYMYDLSTKEETKITTSGSVACGYTPGIDGNRIVWTDYGNGYRPNICMYDLSTKKKTQITTSGKAVSPSIYGNIIVYGDYRSAPPGDSYCDVYMYDLAAKPIKPQAAFTAETTSGKAPLTVYFTDKSTGGTPTSYYWDFGDKTTSKHAYTAKHTFTKPGNYTVSLTVKNTEGSSTEKKTNYVIVTK